MFLCIFTNNLVLWKWFTKTNIPSSLPKKEKMMPFMPWNTSEILMFLIYLSVLSVPIFQAHARQQTKRVLVGGEHQHSVKASGERGELESSQSWLLIYNSGWRQWMTDDETITIITAQMFGCRWQAPTTERRKKLQRAETDRGTEAVTAPWPKP